MSNICRYVRLVRKAVQSFDLDFEGLCVYTEAATGSYRVTAPMAALGGAEHVYAIARDSSHGNRSEAIEQTKTLAEALGTSTTIEFVSEKRPSDIGEADIVTNSGFIRRINAERVSWMRSTAAVPLMFETWEFREDDIDIRACWNNNIPVLGTDESDERVLTQEYVGPLVVKLLLNAEIEIFQSTLVVVGSGPMTKHAVTSLEALDADVTVVSRHPKDKVIREKRVARNLTDSSVLDALAESDALVLIEH